MSVHYWAPTVVSPDGKPFDKKLIKVLLRSPTVNISIIICFVFFFFNQDKHLVDVSAGSVMVAFKPHIHFSRDYRQLRDLVEITCFLSNDKQHHHLLCTHMPRSSISDSSFSVSPCWLFVSFWVAKTLSVRTFTMPFGQSGRTLWNVPKLSNRFQVLRATSQPPTITILCVSCVIGLPAQQYAISPLKARGQNLGIRYASLFTVKYLLIFTIVSYIWFTPSLVYSL